VGAEQRSPEGVIRYKLGDAPAARRARISTTIGVVTSLAPVVLAVVLLNELGWHPNGAFWAVAIALVALVLVRAGVAHGPSRRSLRGLVVAVGEDDIRVESTRDGPAVERAKLARIVEVEGPLGGLRVESRPDQTSGLVSIVNVPRGGEAYGEVRARLEQWRAPERRGRRGPAMRLAIGAVVVAAIFFVPFLLDDFVARSRFVAAGLIVALWVVMRAVLRKR
jgi:hypothetical protein